jgi:DeoR/GlpR family transcriptional regulator of sugar metabolism
MISRAKKVYILCDHSKFGLINRYTFATLDQCTLITDKYPEKGFENMDIIIAD